MRSTWRRALGGLVGMGIVTTIAAPAHALSELDSIGTVLIAAIIVSGAGDLTFTIHDTIVAGKEELPSHGWAVAEMVHTIPQTLIGHVVYTVNQMEGKNEASLQAVIVISTLSVSTLSTHGIWAAATTKVDPRGLMGLSAAVGVNATLTSGVLGCTAAGTALPLAQGVSFDVD